jgi:hypothetical protein
MKRCALVGVLLASFLGVPPALGQAGDDPLASSARRFDEAVAAAREPGSGGGGAVTRAELRHAIGYFWRDDDAVNREERAYLLACLADPRWLDPVSGAARRYASEFVELNAEVSPASITATEVQASLVDLFGAPGALTSSVWVKEGRALGSGSVTQGALRAAYGRAFEASAGSFEPINVRELLNELSGRFELGTPTQDEIDGAMAYLTQGNSAATRLYLASWIGSNRGGVAGDLGGVVVASVSLDRRVVRFVEIHEWTE